VLARLRETSLVASLLLGGVATLFCFTPGLDVPNYHAALLLALFGSVVVGPVGVSRARAAVASAENPFVAVLRATWVPAVLPVAVLLLNGFRVRFCDVSGGLAFMAVGPVFSVLWAAQLGAALALFIPSKRIAVLAFYVVFLAWAAVDVLHILRHPAIFAFNPFAGFFAGAIYDTAIEIDARLVIYRLNNLAQLALLLALTFATWDRSVRRARLLTSNARASRFVLVTVLAVVTFGLWANRATIGYEVSREEVQRRLGGRIEDDRLILIYDKRRISEAEAKLLLEDHGFRLAQIEARLGTRFPRRITSYVYGTPEDKRLLMGAQYVYIAKPWLDEIHLNRVPYGHTVIRHELAHVVLGAFAPPPFRIPTRACVLPNMAVVEGAAETFEWDTGALTPHQWSRAMREAKQAPDLRALLGPTGFLAQGSDKAYTLAGSFIAFLTDRFGMTALQDVYADGDFERVFGAPIDALVGDWERMIDGLSVPEDAAGLATGRFHVKAIQQRPCGLDVARTEAEAARRLADNDRVGAREAYAQVVAWVPEDAQKRLPLLSLAVSSGDLEAVKQAYADYVGVEGNRNAVSDALAREQLADTLARHGEPDAAKPLYRENALAPQPEERKRTSLVKYALASDPSRARDVLPYLLTGRLEVLAKARATRPDDPLVSYLAGRRQHQDGRYAEAVDTLAVALAAFAKLPPSDALEAAYQPWVTREAYRLTADADWQLGRYAEARAAYLRASELTPYGGDAERYRDWAARCAWKLSRTTP
jgi:tetratricopeptide (TPR) repeat protein